MAVQAGQARSSRARRASKAAWKPAASRPVARVIVDISLPHLDRQFEYLVPDHIAEVACPGVRVRVRFSGRLTSGFLIERAETSEHEGRLAFLDRVVSPEPVLTPEIAGLARAVADRYGGTMADVLRLAIPPRHAAVESVPPDPAAAVGSQAQAPPASSWQRYPAGPAFLAALADGRSPRAVWSALPGPSWPDEIAVAVAAVTASGRGTVVVVPDARDCERLDAALTSQLGPGQHVMLSAGLGPAERYRRWLAVRRGLVRVVAGTRSAAFAPVPDLGLVVVWDEGDDLYAEPRAPYPHAREVLALRAHRAGAGALIGGFARTAEAALLLSAGWARPLAAERATVRQTAPAVLATGEDSELARDEGARSARLPSVALRAVRDGLAAGPVLIQVPRQGYVAAVACEQCRTAARCACGGPAQLPGPDEGLRCGWCGRDIASSCSQCGHVGLRALVTGARRTAEELRRAFPSATVVTSGGPAVRSEVSPVPAIVVATPGAEPLADGGYGAAILLDGWALLGRPSLRAAEEAVRRWMNAAALVRPAASGGAVVIVAEPSLPAVQALIRWDPATFADRELEARSQLRFPPAARMAAVTGPADSVISLLSAARLPVAADVLGPVPLAGGQGGRGAEPAADGNAETVRYLVRVPRSEGAQLASALRAGLAERSARKDQGAVRVQLDPAALV